MDAALADKIMSELKTYNEPQSSISGLIVNLTTSDKDPNFKVRVHACINDLVNAGLVEKPNSTSVRLTAEGHKHAGYTAYSNEVERKEIEDNKRTEAQDENTRLDIKKKRFDLKFRHVAVVCAIVTASVAIFRGCCEYIKETSPTQTKSPSKPPSNKLRTPPSFPSDTLLKRDSVPIK